MVNYSDSTNTRRKQIQTRALLESKEKKRTKQTAANNANVMSTM
jgi:hypothetical protein